MGRHSARSCRVAAGSYVQLGAAADKFHNHVFVRVLVNVWWITSSAVWCPRVWLVRARVIGRPSVLGTVGVGVGDDDDARLLCVSRVRAKLVRPGRRRLVRAHASRWNKILCLSRSTSAVWCPRVWVLRASASGKETTRDTMARLG